MLTSEGRLDVSATVSIMGASAEILRAIAWPVVAAIAMMRFSPELRNLLHRLRKGGGAEFDPPGQQGEVRAPALPAQVPFERTPALKGWEDLIRQLPALKGVDNPEQREEILVNTMARMMLMYTFDLTDSLIYGSQVQLLLHLNVRTGGDSADHLKQLYFDPARKQFPDIYEAYDFEPYLGFLQTRGMVEIVDGVAHITDTGREYLSWRVAMRKLPRVVG